MLLKKMNIIILGSCVLLLLMPFPASAEESTDEKGQIDWKIDRITEDERSSDYRNEETELEQTFPELFKEETHGTIESVEEENSESLKELEKALFTMDSEENTMIADTKEALFTSDYVVPETSTQKQQDDEAGSSGFNSVLMAGLTGLASIVGAGVYIMVQRLGE